jgi:hypothetical protein
MDHSTLLRRVGRKMNAEELRPIIATLEQSGIISTMISGERQKIIYTLNKEK